MAEVSHMGDMKAADIENLETSTYATRKRVSTREPQDTRYRLQRLLSKRKRKNLANFVTPVTKSSSKFDDSEGFSQITPRPDQFDDSFDSFEQFTSVNDLKNKNYLTTTTVESTFVDIEGFSQITPQSISLTYFELLLVGVASGIFVIIIILICSFFLYRKIRYLYIFQNPDNNSNTYRGYDSPSSIQNLPTSVSNDYYELPMNQ